MKPAAIAAEFVGLRTVASRKVCVLHFECPIEKIAHVLDCLGSPRTDESVPVGIAKLVAKPVSETAPAKADKKRQPWDTMSRAQQAGVLCNDPRFQNWLVNRYMPDWAGTDPDRNWSADETAAFVVREVCNVQSRKELDGSNQNAGRHWDQMVVEYRAATGQLAEQRS